MSPRSHRRATLAARLALVATCSFPLAPASALAAIPAPPPTRVAVVVDSLHGVPIEDPYRWLEDQGAPETRDWVKSQMAFTQEQLARVPGREEVLAILARHAKVDTRTVPTVRGRRLFFMSRRADQQQPVITMRESADGPDVVLVDANPLSTDGNTSVSMLNVSRDGKLLAYGVRKGGEDEVELRLFDVDKRADVGEKLPRARYQGVSIDRQNKGFWYGRWSPEGTRIRYHRVGDDPANDAVVFGEGLGPESIPSAALSANGRWLKLTVSKGSASDDTKLYLKNVESNGPVVTVADTLKCNLSFDMAGDQLVIETNWRAPNRRVFVADARRPQVAHWKEVVPESPDAVIEDVSTVGGRLYVTVLKDVTSRLRVYSLDGTAGGEVPLPDLGSLSAMTGEWDGKEGFFQFSSFHRPPTIYRYDTASGNAAPWWRSPDPFDPESFEVRQFSIRSTHGAKVPFFVVQRKGTTFDGKNKVLMSGYGGFNLNQRPAFSRFVASWLELGGVYVLTNLRGGSEFGDAWHQGGMRANKQNTFDDFLNITQWILTRGYCLRQGLAIRGGSNGGLLVGAAMTQRPDLYGAVICRTPLLDMLRYHRFSVARFWVPEYGSSENAEEFDWLRAYSPYHRVKAGVKYPAVLFVTGDSDTRVDPLHARKMAALLQSVGGENPVLLHYDVSTGHTAGKSVDRSMQDEADELQFLRWRLGMVPVP